MNAQPGNTSAKLRTGVNQLNANKSGMLLACLDLAHDYGGELQHVSLLRDCQQH